MGTTAPASPSVVWVGPSDHELIEGAIALGDQNSRTLGFMPHEVYKQAAATGTLVAAVTDGKITLVKSSDLAVVQKGVKAFDRLTLVLPLITIVLIALSLWLSVNRRRTMLQLAVGVSLLMIVERRVVIHEQGALASAAHNPQVAQSVLGDLLHGYFVLTGWVLGVALVVLVIAVLSGPYRWAVAFRSQVTRTGRSIAAASSGDRRGQVVTWMASHAAGLQLAGAVAAGILLLTILVYRPCSGPGHRR